MVSPVKYPGPPGLPHGKVFIEHDNFSHVLKIKYIQPNTLHYAVAQELLASAYDSKYVVHEVAKQMASYVAQDIEQQLMALLHKDGMQYLWPKEKVFSYDQMKGLYGDLNKFSAFSTPPEQQADFKSMMAAMTKVYKKNDTYYAPSSSGGVQSTLEKAIPGLKGAKSHCPDKQCPRSAAEEPLTKVIVHLNDGHKWKREKIADWLETLDCDLAFKTPEGGEEA